MRKNALVLAALLPLFILSLTTVAHAETHDITIQGYTYGFYTEWDSDNGIWYAHLFTNDTVTFKATVRYWNGTTAHGKEDLIHRDVEIVGGVGLDWTPNPAYADDPENCPKFCENWYVQVHFHNTLYDLDGTYYPDGGGSIKVGGEDHVPWFTNLGMALLATIGSVTILRRKVKLNGHL